MYSRGDIVAVHFPFSDGSASKLRPALVLSNSTIENSGDIILVMITSSVREKDLKVELTSEKVSVQLPKQSYVKCHRLFTIEQNLISGKISSITSSGMNEVIQTILKIIGE